MDNTHLFYTALPVLLGDHAVAARLAFELCNRHRKKPHWFGSGFHPLLSLCAEGHPLPLPFTPENDTVQLTRLKDFAKQQRHSGGLLCLIPCGDTALAFLNRNERELSEYYLLLPCPEKGTDPLMPLLRHS